MLSARRGAARPRPARCRAWMVRTERWKYVHWQDFPPQLFDLDGDPQERRSRRRRGARDVRQEMRERLLAWFMRLKRRVTVTDDEVEAGTATHKKCRRVFRSVVTMATSQKKRRTPREFRDMHGAEEPRKSIGPPLRRVAQCITATARFNPRYSKVQSLAMPCSGLHSRGPLDGEPILLFTFDER